MGERRRARVELHLFALRLHVDESRHEGGSMSAGSCGPLDDDDGDVDTAYDALAIEADALRVENRLLRLELRKMRDVIRDVNEALTKLLEEKA